jgi:hypothetical protein
MKKTFVLLMVLAVALAAGLTVVGCDTATNNDAKEKGPDAALNET